MDGGEGGYLSRRTHSGICGRSTTGTRSRRGDVPARRRGGGELSHGAESAPVGATCIRHGRTILDAVRAEEPARRRVVLGGRDFRSQYETAVGYANGNPGLRVRHVSGQVLRSEEHTSELQSRSDLV